MNHGELDHGLGLSRVDLVVSVQTAAVGEPGKGTLDDPPLGQHDGLAGLVAFDDFDDPAEHRLCPGNQFPGVAAVDVDFLREPEVHLAASFETIAQG